MCPACLASIAIVTALSTTGVTASVAAALGIRKVIKNKKNLATEKNHEYDSDSDHGTDHDSDHDSGNDSGNDNGNNNNDGVITVSESNEQNEEDNGSRSEGAPSAG